MNNKFDELSKVVVQAVTRRQALQRFGLGLAGLAMTAIGLQTNARAQQGGGKGGGNCNHCSGAPFYGCAPDNQACIHRCMTKCCILCPK